MTELVEWRALAGLFVLWSVYVGVWSVVTSSGPVPETFWWLAGAVCLGALRLAAQRHSLHGRLAGAVRVTPRRERRPLGAANRGDAPG